MNEMNQLVKALFEIPTHRVDDEKNQRAALDQRIFELITPRSLRLGSLDQATTSMLQDKIKLSIEENKPITLIIGFGGFKNFKISGSPHINWAEVFHISFLIQTLWEVAHIYKPGLHIEFTGDDVMLPMLNNYKDGWTKVYNDEFSVLLSEIQSKMPDNIVLVNRPASSFYNQIDLEDEITRHVEGMDLNANQEVIESKIDKARNNFCFDGKTDYTNADDNLKRQLLERSTLIHGAWIDVDYKHRREYLEGGLHIPVLHRKGIPGCYNIRSLKSSDVQFWEAYGVIAERTDGTYYQTLLSVNQYSNADVQLVAVENIFTHLGQFTEVPLISA